MSEIVPTAHPERSWAAFAAIDWADQKHFWNLLPADSQQSEQGSLDNTPEAVEDWAAALRRRFGGRPIAICLEQSRGALIYMLAKYDHLVLFPAHPTTAARYRETFCPSGAKADSSDAALLLDLLLRHRERLHQWQPDTLETRLLQVLTEQRRRLVNEKTRQSLRLMDCLKIYFPQLLTWFRKVGSTRLGAVLERWGTLQEMQHEHPGTLRQFFRQHICRDEETIRQRIDAIYGAVPATQDQAILEGLSMTAHGLAAVLKTLREQIAQLDLRIAKVVVSHPETGLFSSLPGAGPVLIPRLIVVFGTCRERWQSASQIQALSGIAPVTKASGKSQWVHFRFACPKFMRQTFQEFANCSIRFSPWARTYYDAQRDQGKAHQAAIRALAFKWIRIIYRCWKDGRPYNEQAYLQHLRERNSPVRQALATGFQWTTVAGFSKLTTNPS